MPAPSQPAAWLDAWLAAFPWQEQSEQAGALLTRAVAGLPARQRLAILKEAVARMPGLRRAKDDDSLAWRKGTALYQLVGELYAERLPCSEEDICTLLRTSKHDCGHGSDVTAPFEKAVEWARENGVTAEWLSALRTFIDNLRGLVAAKAQDLKKKGGLLLLLLDSAGGAAGKCWSDSFRADLARLPEDQRRAWQGLVLHMSVGLGGKPSKGLRKEIERLVETLGLDAILDRLEAWLPDPDAQAEARPSVPGSHLLRNFIWLAEGDDGSAAQTRRVDALLERLTRMSFTPREPLKKVALALASHFVERPPEVGHAPLRRIREWEKTFERTAYDSEKIGALVAAYEAKHG